MFGRTVRVPLATAVFGLAALAVGQPALADTELGHTGTVGAHSLTDTSSQPGAKCHYNFNSGLGLGKLKTIEVRPPNMSPVRTKQVVGWQFTIQRRFVGSSTGPWKQVYRSVTQTTSIGGGDSGGFTSMTAPISLPSNEGANGEHFYRVIVKMIWYHADSSVMGTARHRVDFYRGVMNTGEHWTDDGSCGGLSPS
jgi:hypothetical protein